MKKEIKINFLKWLTKNQPQRDKQIDKLVTKKEDERTESAARGLQLQPGRGAGE